METPTTKGTSDIIVAQLEGTLSSDVPLLPKAFTRVLAKVLAGVFILLWKYAAWIFLQILGPADASFAPTTINGTKRRPLVDWGRLLGVDDPVAGSPATLDLTVTVTNQVGTLPAGTPLTRAGTETVYLTVAPAPLSAPTVPVRVRATTDGIAGNAEPGESLRFANPTANVAPAATVSSVVAAGVDSETEASYRARVLAKPKEPPKGGAFGDYVDWTLTVPDIVKGYPYDGNDDQRPGEVDVFIEVDAAVDPDGLADLTHRNAVYAAIQDVDPGSGKARRRPIGAAVNVNSIGRSALELHVYGLVVPDPTSTKATIEAAIDEFLRTREPYIIGLSDLPRSDRITGADFAAIVDTIVNAAGGTVNKVKLAVSEVERDIYELGRGEKTKLLINSGQPVYVP